MKIMQRRWSFMVGILPYIMGTAIAVGLKYQYSRATCDDLLWILRPTASLVEWLSGVSFIHDPLAGFINIRRGIAIAPACSGVNFLLIAYCMSFFSFAHRYDTAKKRLRWFAVTLSSSYFLTIAVNSLRICVSIESITRGLHFGWLTPERIHRIEGVMVYFLFLSLFYHAMKGITGWHDVVKDDPTRRERRLKKGLFFDMSPLLWYLLVALAVPVLTGNYRDQGGRFIEHGAVILVSCTVALLLLNTIFRLLLHVTGRCGIKRKMVTTRYNDQTTKHEVYYGTESTHR
jgi:exosortase K